MKIEITLEKIIERGDPKFLVKNIVAAKSDGLPDKYLNGVPKVWHDGYKDLFIWGSDVNAFGPPQFKLKVGYIYDTEYINETMEITRRSGERLAEINKGIEEMKKTWHGERDRPVEDFSDPSTMDDPGTIQLWHESGLLVNVPCYHGEKLPEKTGDIRCAWNGKSWDYELIHLRTDGDKVYPIVCCRHCGRMWRYEWADVLPYVYDTELKKRLTQYASEEIAQIG